MPIGLAAPSNIMQGAKHEIRRHVAQHEHAESIRLRIRFARDTIHDWINRGTVLAAQWNGLQWAWAAPVVSAQAATIQSGTGAWRARVSPEVFGDRRLTLLVATPLTDVGRERREAQEAMLVGIPLILLLTIGGGVYLVVFASATTPEHIVMGRRYARDGTAIDPAPFAITHTGVGPSVAFGGGRFLVAWGLCGQVACSANSLAGATVGSDGAEGPEQLLTPALSQSGHWCSASDD